MELLIKLLVANRRIVYILVIFTAIGYFCGSALAGFFIGALIISLVNLF